MRGSGGGSERRREESIPMKITRIEPIPISVPLKKGMTAKTAHGEHVTSPYVIVKILTDEGLVGLGEATISGLWSGETQAGTVAAIRDYIAPQLVGKDPRDITTARRAMDFIIKLNPFTKCAVEMALWDIAGRAVNLPVYQLLGGKVRDKVRIKLVVWARDVPGSRTMTEEHLALGVTCVKVKTGLDPESDIARVRAVSEVTPKHIPVTIDSNCGWTIQQAKYCLRALADVNLLLAEQPIPAGDPAALAELRRDTPTPIMADESVFTLQDAWLLTTPPRRRHPQRLSRQAWRHRGNGRDHRGGEGGRPALHNWLEPRTRDRDRGDAPRRGGVPGSRLRQFPGRHHRPVLPRWRDHHQTARPRPATCEDSRWARPRRGTG